MAGRYSRMSGSARDALPDVRGEVGMPSRKIGSGLEALLDVRKALPDVREWSGGPSGCPGEVGRPFRMSGSGRKPFPDIQEWLGDPPGSLRVVGRPSQMSGNGWEALPDVRGGQETLQDFLQRRRGPPG